MINRRVFLGTSVATAAALTAGASFAAEPPVFAEGGVAIRGYDPVAYFTESKPVEGSSAHSTSYDGATWHFASAENLATFEADPAKYAPQYGGYCAYAVANGYTASTQPNAWSIHNGKLYLNFNRAVRARWAISKDKFIKQGDANWPTVLG